MESPVIAPVPVLVPVGISEQTILTGPTFNGTASAESNEARGTNRSRWHRYNFRASLREQPVFRLSSFPGGDG
jgi:hypothetical protein